MIVYRLEDSDGFGPWSTPYSGKKNKCFFYVIGTVTCEFFSLSPFNNEFKSRRFGCVSIEQMKSTITFMKEHTNLYIKAFDKKGFRIVKYYVPNQKVLADETQCVFDHDYAVKIGEEDYKVLLKD